MARAPLAVILSACRTPIGSFGGSLKDLTAPDLGAVVIREAISRARLKDSEIGEVVLGCVLQAAAGMNVARAQQRLNTASGPVFHGIRESRCPMRIKLGFICMISGLPGQSWNWRENSMATSPTQPSLYDRLGGVYSIAVVVDAFIDRVMADPRLNANPAVDEAHHKVPPAGFKYLVTEMVCWATGGPQRYTGRSMLESHAHLDITAQEWQVFLEDFRACLAHFAVPAAEHSELFAIVESTKGDIVRQVPGQSVAALENR